MPSGRVECFFDTLSSRALIGPRHPDELSRPRGFARRTSTVRQRYIRLPAISTEGEVLDNAGPAAATAGRPAVDAHDTGASCKGSNQPDPPNASCMHAAVIKRRHLVDRPGNAAAPLASNG
jgi:hypothetical protein